jgi:hypothetical protein
MMLAKNTIQAKLTKKGTQAGTSAKKAPTSGRKTIRERA